MAQNQGTVVGGTLRPNDSQDRFPIAFNKELKGGYRSVLTIAERDAIYAEHRELLMQVRVIQQGRNYELKNGITNADWEIVGQINLVENSPKKLDRVWFGTKSEFKTLKLAALLEADVEYNYEEENQAIRNPDVPVSYILTEFDNEVDQIVITACNFTLDAIVGKFSCTITVTENVTCNVYGTSALSRLKNGVKTTGNQLLEPGCWRLKRIGETANFVIC